MTPNMLRIATLSGLALLATPANAAPWHIEAGISYLPPAGNWTALTFDAEAGPKNSPFGFIAAYQAGSPGSIPLPQITRPLAATIVGKYQLPVFSEDSLTAFAGVNYYPESWFTSDSAFRSYDLFFSPIVGATYTLRSDRIWVKISPQYVFSRINPPYENTGIFKSAIPLAEFGVALSPTIDLSARLSFTPIRVGVRF
ncbi:hypothetical protein D3C86_1251260 [compost metagenome]